MSTTQETRTSEFWMNAFEKPSPILPQYPDLRFFCPQCESLEVFFSFSNGFNIGGKCLDCHAQWEEEQDDSKASN